MVVTTAQRRRLQGLCPKCGEKPEEGFVNCANCREKLATRQTRYQRQDGYRYHKERYAERRKWWRELRSQHACRECGESHPATLDFHHRDPSTKKFNIAAAACSRMNKEKVLAEMTKCDVLCANCHRKAHWKEDY